MDTLTDALSELFGYNRGNFMFDRKLRQEREYMEQDMRIARFLLYREDVRDLTELTVSKMDNYLMIALLEMGCCLDLLVEGVIRGPSQGERDGEEVYGQPPSWLLWLYVISLAEAMLYLFLSTWLAIHASVSAHSFCVRLLTQYVRLPVPTFAQLDAAAAKATDFERMSAEDLVRVPVLQEQLQRLAGRQGSAPADSSREGGAEGLIQLAHAANPTLALEHIKVYRGLQANWQAYDAYARACLCIGTYMLLHALAYYSVGLLVVELNSPWPSLGCALALPCLAWLLMRLDLYFRDYKRVLGAMLLVSGPLWAFVAATLLLTGESSVLHVVQVSIVPVIFLLHIVLIYAIYRVARAENVYTPPPVPGVGARSTQVAIPTRFRAVLYLDVFGWFSGPEDAAAAQPPAGAAAGAPASAPRGPGTLPERGQEALRGYLGKVLAFLSLELSTWLGGGNAANLRAVPELRQELHQAQRELDELQQEFERIVRLHDGPGAASASSAAATGAEAETPAIWLRLDHCHGRGPEMRCFVCPRLGQEQLEPPEDGALVSDLAGIKERLATLRRELPHLLALQAEAAGQGGQGGRQPPGGGGVGRGPPPPQEEDQAPPSQATQETRFGGQEALSAEAASVAQTFYPRASLQSSRAPGEVPWQTFWWGSAVLAAVWAFGLLFYAIAPVYSALVGDSTFIIDTDMDQAAFLEPVSRLSLTGGQLLLGARDWPDLAAPQRPLDLVCHPLLGDAVLVVERFAVSELTLPRPAAAPGSVPGDLALPPGAALEAIDSCLAAAPRFHSRGLAGAGVDCQRGSCVAVLLGASGGALRCPLAAATMAAGARRAPPVEVRLAADRRHLEALHPRGAVDPQLRPRSWRLPEGRRWAAACAAGDGTDVLAVERGGEVWRFALPAGQPRPPDVEAAAEALVL